jgi:hypothetical protein
VHRIPQIHFVGSIFLLSHLTWSCLHLPFDHHGPDSELSSPPVRHVLQNKSDLLTPTLVVLLPCAWSWSFLSILSLSFYCIVLPVHELCCIKSAFFCFTPRFLGHTFAGYCSFLSHYSRGISLGFFNCSSAAKSVLRFRFSIFPSGRQFASYVTSRSFPSSLRVSISTCCDESPWVHIGAMNRSLICSFCYILCLMAF